MRYGTLLAIGFAFIAFLEGSSQAQVTAVPVSQVNNAIDWQFLNRALRGAGKIFAGTVMQVEHGDPASSSVLATTNVTFRVDEAIRGVRKGQILEIREWAGLWQVGEHYRAGQRVLLFLYPPSKLGLTSPVGHQAGRFSIDASGNVLLSGQPGFTPKPIAIHKVVAAIRRVEIR